MKIWSLKIFLTFFHSVRTSGNPEKRFETTSCQNRFRSSVETSREAGLLKLQTSLTK